MNKIINWLFYAYLLLFPLAQLTRIPPQRMELSEVHFYLTDVVVAGIVLVWVLGQMVDRKRFKKPPLASPIIAFFLFSLLSLFLASFNLDFHQTINSSLYLIRWIFYAGIYFVIFDSVQRGKLRSEKLVNWLGWAGVISAVLGLIQYVIIPDTRFLSKYGWDDHYYRIIGTFLDPGYLGIILTLTLIILTFKLLMRNENLILYKILWAITYLSFALTYSRASYVAFLVAMLGISLLKNNLKFFAKILFLFTVTLILLPRPGGEGVRLERDSTIKFRIINWGHALTIAKDNLAFGVGFNTYRYAQMRYGYVEERTDEGLSHSAAGVDSSLLFVLATTGIPGLLIYLWFWKKSLRTKSFLVLISGIALLVHSLFTNTLFYPWIMGWWWILLGSDKIEMK